MLIVMIVIVAGVSGLAYIATTAVGQGQSTKVEQVTGAENEENSGANTEATDQEAKEETTQESNTEQEDANTQEETTLDENDNTTDEKVVDEGDTSASTKKASFFDNNKIKLGLDLQGGVNIVYEPKLEGDMTDEDLADAITKNIHELVPKHITKEDIIASINYNIHLEYGIGTSDDIDHLGNRRIRAVGELLQNQYRIGLSRLERVVRERMTTHDAEEVSPQVLVNIKPVQAAVKEFFGSSQIGRAHV